MSTDVEKVDFDQFAADYESLLETQGNPLGGERAFFSEYKIQLLAKLFPEGFGSILDFGAGVGLTTPYILKYFAASKVFATDISEASLAHIAKKHPQVRVVPDSGLAGMKFDLILVITVLHHIAPHLRKGVMERLAGLLEPGGRLCIFEHNPYNPVTQRMVSTCPFDKDAVLLTKGEAESLLRDGAGLEVGRSGYTLFVPEALKGLRVLEPALYWLPLGGQYYVIGGAA